MADRARSVEILAGSAGVLSCDRGFADHPLVLRSRLPGELARGTAKPADVIFLGVLRVELVVGAYEWSRALGAEGGEGVGGTAAEDARGDLGCLVGRFVADLVEGHDRQPTRAAAPAAPAFARTWWMSLSELKRAMIESRLSRAPVVSRWTLMATGTCHFP